VCVVVDKMEKLPREAVVAQLGDLGVPATAVDGILNALSLRSLDDLAALLGEGDASGDAATANGASSGGGDAATANGSGGTGALSDLRRLWELAQGYGYADWLVFDASVVRGLAYYTGVVFEGFDRAGALRAICGGGRYDKLLGTFGGADAPCAGFGFGDAVIVELLKDRGLLPTPLAAVDDVVLVMDEPLRAAACGVAAQLRAAGRSVDVILEPRKKVKAAIKAAERAGAKRIVIVGGDEWARGAVAVRDLEKFEQSEVAVDALASASAATAEGGGSGAGSKRPRTE
jgi:histidyl-tRNA synthetase